MRRSLLACCLSFSALAFPACGRHASPAECAALLDRFVRMKLGEDPATRALDGGAYETARLAKVRAMQGDPDVQEVERACEAEVSRAEYDCAIKASTSRAWNDCIQ
jgi:hypothetical protein